MGTTGTTGPSRTRGETRGERAASSGSQGRTALRPTPALLTAPAVLAGLTRLRSAVPAASTTPTPTPTGRNLSRYLRLLWPPVCLLESQADLSWTSDQLTSGHCRYYSQV